ncbi:hypothetical protein HIM_12244 [Hirsutella minnesotensis 3608]|uniref:MULE transposase domain-containing protein n=1 Tax=Hirsutella minnesotensis 3608 TaxID=1043627 RepID=A0A0F7ZI91_9HYPO|nr:hypothetical protein HIM_12244 [Hirsutella minnesotensis 3608]
MDSVFPDDVLPPEGLYESRESLVAAVNDWAKPRGYAFITGKSLKTANGRVRVILACDRNKLPPSASAERECAKHNHPPSEDPSAHPAHRRLTEQDAKTISSLALCGTAASDIRTYIHNHSESLATERDIYNWIAATRRDLREGQSSIQALVNQLNSEGFWCQVKLDSDNRLTAIFFAHPESVAYLQCNPDVLLLDCTYKTNKYEMPLLDMVGVDSCQRSFCIAFAFLSGESEEDYSWALQHLRSLYDVDLPSVVLTDRCIAAMNAAAIWFSTAKALLCLWHVNKAVLQRCRPVFKQNNGNTGLDQSEDDIWNEFYAFWHSIVASPNERAFEERLAEFEHKYGEKYSDSVEAEGIHSLVKSHIKTSNFDLFDVWQAMRHAITNQLKELKHLRVSQQVRLPLDVSGVLFEAVRGWVSHHALRKVQEQRQLCQKQNMLPCGQSFTTSHGLPCSHTLKKLEEDKRSLLLENFHPHWHLKRGMTQPLPILEPRRAIDRLSLRRIQPATSIRREQSAFELVEGKQRAPRKCSRCNTPGHIKSSEQCPLRHMTRPAEAVQIPNTAVEPSPTMRSASCTASAYPTATILTTSENRSCERRMSDTVFLDRHSISTTPARHDPCPSPTMQEIVAPHSPAGPDHLIDSRRELASRERLDESLPLRRGNSWQLPPRYDSPEAIYQRYVAARGAWYAAQPAGSIKTNQQFRSAMGLPQRYGKQSYKWCLDYKQMSKSCVTSMGSRNWTKEEMMAYLDWSTAEDERIEAQVTEEMGDNPLANTRKGMGEIWQRVEEDSRKQGILQSGKANADCCIFVRA